MRRYLSDLGPRRRTWRRDSNSSTGGGDGPAWARVPLTPELRAAKAAREQALQRAPLIRRSEAILYQVLHRGMTCEAFVDDCRCQGYLDARTLAVSSAMNF